MKVRISQRADEDLREIEEYIGSDNPRASIDFILRLTERFEGLSQFPGMGRKRDEVRIGYRSVSEGDYVILYRPAIEDDELEVVRVIHAKRDLGKALTE